MSKTFDEFLKQTDSMLGTLNKDYEAMKLQKSDRRSQQQEIFNTLTADLVDLYDSTVDLIIKYEKQSGYLNSGSDCPTHIVYDDGQYVYFYRMRINWSSDKPMLKLRVSYVTKDKYTSDGQHFHSCSDLCIEQDKEVNIPDSWSQENMADYISVFLNHCPCKDQLEIAWQETLTAYVKECMEDVQHRNEILANKIKEVNK